MRSSGCGKTDCPELQLFGGVGDGLHCFQSYAHCVVNGTSTIDENSKGSRGWEKGGWWGGGHLLELREVSSERAAQNKRIVEPER